MRALTSPSLWGTVPSIFSARLRCYADVHDAFAERVGLELGGPSSVFQSGALFPVYPLAARIDNCNFSSETIWEGRIETGASFSYDEARAPGRQYVAEATALEFAAPGAYDFVLSSHMLEHTANPVGALLEWKRVLRPNGLLVLFLPHRDATFDHRRPVTTLEHLVQDFDRSIGEDDLTHLEEILALHDLARDPEAGGFEMFRARSLDNLHNRGLHHHVFDKDRAVELVDHVQFAVRAVETAYPCHIAIVASKPPDAESVDNRAFLRRKRHREGSSAGEKVRA